MLMCTLIHVATDWWGTGATFFSGIITAIATMGAVIYSSYRSQKQSAIQDEKYRKEREEQFKLQKYVVIKPSLLLNSFTGIIDKVIIQNDYNRMLLLSGDDGFDFFDDMNKRMSQTCRMLLIENQNTNNIEKVVICTKSDLLNMDTDEKTFYETNNIVSLLRGGESIIIRLMNQEQYMKILDMNQKGISSVLDFNCKIEYSTLAHQRIEYIYQVKISNDKRIEIIQDNIISVKDEDCKESIQPSIFRNIQDCISGIDRSNYCWMKMGQAMTSGIMSYYNSGQAEQNIKEKQNKDDTAE